MTKAQELHANSPTMAFKKLVAMGPEKIEMVDHLLLKGESPLKVARMIQKEWKLNTSISEESLKKQLVRYKNANIKNVSFLTAADPKEKRVILKRVEAQLNIMQELTELVEVQKERVLMAIEKERTVKMPFSWLRKDIDSLAILLNQLAEHQFKLGIIHEIPKTTLVQHDSQGNTLIQSSSSATSHDMNIKIGQQTAAAAQEVLRLIGLSHEELIKEQDAIEAEYTNGPTS